MPETIATSQRSLSDRLKGAAAWTAFGHVLAQAIKLASNLVMTYLLVPSDFGVMAIVGVLLVGITLVSDVGTSQNLIANPRGADSTFRNTVWTFQMVRGWGTWLLACLVAYGFYLANAWGYFPEESVYADERLPWIIVGTFAQSMIQGFQSTKVVMAQRNVTVKEMVLLKIYAQVAALVPMFLIAWWYRSVWALVAGGVAAILVQVILSHTMIPGVRDRLAWDRRVLEEVWGFGRWIMLSSFIGFLASCGDRILLGHFVNATQLGLYAIAGLLVAPIQSVYTMLITSVVFPGISEVNRISPEKLPRSYQRFQRYADILAAGGAGLLWVIGPSAVHLLYQKDYHAAGEMLSILGLGLIGLRFYVVEQCYMVKGKAQLMTAANALRLFALVTLIPIGFHLNGLTGAIIGVAASTYAAWPLALYFRAKHRLGGLKADLWLIPAFLTSYVLSQGVVMLLDSLPRIHH